MSLIYSALRNGDSPRATGARAPVAPRAGSVPTRGVVGRQRDLGVVVFGIALGLLLALGLQLLEWNPASAGGESLVESRSPAATVEPAPRELAFLPEPLAMPAGVIESTPQQPAADLTPVLARPLPEVAKASKVAEPAVVNEPLAVEPLPEVVPQAVTVASTTENVSERGTVTASVTPEPSARPEPVRVERIDEPEPGMDPQQRIAAMRQAMADGDERLAARHLQALEEALPESSLTLLRVQAWWQRENDQPEQAIVLYQQVLERLPDDMDAGLNLAALYWQQQRADSALDILRELRQRHPESAQVERYWQIMRPGRRG